MHASAATLKYVPIRSPTPPLGSSTEDLDELHLEQELEKLDSTISDTRKPHFLDYDSIPPPDFDDHCIAITPGQVNGNVKHPGELLKVDKIYERDGEVSDFEFAATTERRIHRSEKLGIENELIQNGANGASTSMTSSNNDINQTNGAVRKKKHFLDENPIPPDYERHEREHLSLDRSYDRTSRDFEFIFNADAERRHSLDRGRSKKSDEPSYQLSRFLQTDDSPMLRGTWPGDKPHEHHNCYNSQAICGGVAQLNPKVAGMYSLLSMLGCEHNSLEMSSKFFELSKSAETCASLRQAGCIPMLVQKIHSDADEMTKKYASMTLHNVVNLNCHPDDKVGRREAKVLRHIEQIMEYKYSLKTQLENGETSADDTDQHPLQTIFPLMKVSFDQEHRDAMTLLGALQAIASVVHYHHLVHGTHSKDQKCFQFRRYAGMALTNLTFGHDNNKKLLCANKDFMRALVGQIDSPDELVQVTANVFRNLSWHANYNMKTVLNENRTVTALTKAAIANTNEQAIRAILSALWNLCAHSSNNRIELCEVDGALSFLVDMLTYTEQSKASTTIIENAGGILSNISALIARNEGHRKILRQKNCLGILLQQLKSESLTVVNNACGTLWNLSARCPEDQQFLWDNGAVPMLRSLINSKHQMISQGSNAALRNLLHFKPGEVSHNYLDPVAKMMNLRELPTLNMRKQKAMQQELDQNLAETCDNLDITASPKEETTLVVLMNNSNVYQGRKIPDTAPVRNCRSASASGCTASGTSTSTIKPDVKIRHEPRSQSAGALKKATKFPSDKQTPNGHSDVTNHGAHPIPARRTTKENSAEPAKYQETDLDQITDFSLLYAENQTECSDAEEPKPKSRWDTFDDAVKCYETEGTPYTMSSAASISDLRQTPKCTANGATNKSNESGHVTVENTGINTPEKPIKYCEEGTPGYTSVHDSFSSLDDEERIQLPSLTIANNSAAVHEFHNDDRQLDIPPVECPYEEAAEAVEPCAVVPTTPGGTTSKAVTFTEFLETPLMFSRHSSMQSLSSIEPTMGDDKSSVISEVSRMSSGIISPSDLPDSPSQTIPQSPRGIPVRMTSPPIPSNAMNSDGRLRSVFEDEINTFGVENTPAHFSCATSLSNLSLDDEPKIATDCLIKEMRLMNHPSDDQDETPIDNVLDVQIGLISNDSQINVDRNLAVDDTLLSDSDESAKDSLLLEQCINMGMNMGSRANQNANVAPPLPPRNVPRENSSMAPPDDCSSEDGFDNDPLLNQCIQDGIKKCSNSVPFEALDVRPNSSPYARDDCESTDGSDTDNDILLEQCIRDGMEKSTNISKPIVSSSPSLPEKLVKESPIGMFRKGGHSLHHPHMDEVTRHHQEDTPCNFSVMSALSDLTVGSNVAGLVNPNRLCNEPTPSNYTEDSNQPLSPLSIESDRDLNTVKQAMFAATDTRTKVPPVPPRKSNLPPMSSKPIVPPKSLAAFPQLSNEPLDTNDSLSSIDSSDDINEQLLEQCIRLGMQKATVTNKQQLNASMPQQQDQRLLESPKRSQLPVFRSISQVERDRQKEQDHLDDQLLRECINTGIEKNVRTDQKNDLSNRQSRSILAPTNQQQKQSKAIRVHSVGSKNEEATSAAVLVQMSLQGAPNTNTVPGVEMPRTFEIKNGPGTDHHQPHASMSPLVNASSINPISSPRNNVAGTKHTMIKIGCSPVTATLTESTGSNGFGNGLHMSFASMNHSCESDELLHSNEYPASAMSSLEYNDDSIIDSSIDMKIPNEFLTGAFGSISTSQKIDKHKDPDLMLRSVERLTQELVSTAEMLRTSSSQNENSLSENNKSDGNNHTWNEDSCANDISFPSISLTAPLIASIGGDSSCSNTSNIIRYESIDIVHEDEPTPTNEHRSFVISRDHPDGCLNSIDTMDATLKCGQLQPDSLNSDTNTIVETGGECSSAGESIINFQVGGEVQQTFRNNISSYMSKSPFSIETDSTMTNSTIIAIEANKLCANLLDMAIMTDSLDIDHIRPPSVMDNVSMSGHLDAPNSPQLSRLLKRSLPQGIMARRALTQNNPNGSLESINSSCNLDNIKPPSLMDELLDSMISVDSITSEVVEHSPIAQQDGEEISQYETANSEYDDTTTLQSCMDIPMDATPIPSDFSSTESTPKKSKSSRQSLCLTPVQRRQANKERYRTYTIPLDAQHSDNGGKSGGMCQMENDVPVTDEMIHLEIEEVPTRKLTPRQKRQEDRTRFQTQVLDGDMIARSSSSVESSPQTPRRIRDNSRYLTRTISHDETKTQRRNLFNEPATENGGTYTRKFSVQSHEFLLNEDSDSISLVSEDNDEMSSIRALTEKFKHLKDITASRLPTNSNGYSERNQPKCTESQLNSIEYELNSETESFDQNHDIDEDTYTIQKVKPRIVKPIERDRSLESGNSESSGNSPEIKAIRGRKKAAYVSPYKITNTEKSMPKNGVVKATSPKIITEPSKAASITRPSSLIAKTASILNKTNIANKLKPVFTTNNGRKNAVVEKSSIIQPASAGQAANVKPTIATTSLKTAELIAPPPQMPDRQGTFIKDAPENVDVPIVYSEPSSPVKTISTQSKIPSTSKPSPATLKTNFISKLRSPLQRSATTTQTISSVQTTIRNSSAGGVSRSPSTPYVSQRSNSNASIKSTTSSASSTNKAYSQPPSRSNSNISSRIAGLWKRSNSDAKKTSPTNSVMTRLVTPNRNSPNAVVMSRPPSGSAVSPLKDVKPMPKTPLKIVPKTNTTATVKTTKVPGGVLLRNKNAVKLKTTDDETKRISRLGSFV